jgi:hypothetical protein
MNLPRKLINAWWEEDRETAARKASARGWVLADFTGFRKCTLCEDERCSKVKYVYPSFEPQGQR